MKNLKIIKLILCFTIMLPLLIVIYYYITINKMNPYYHVEYAKGIQLKFEKLKLIKQKKIVIIGGSNVNFGIDSDIMEERLMVPIVNMGIHAGLGTMFMLDSIEKYLNPEDTLIISREYSNDGLYLDGTELAPYFTYILSESGSIFKNLKQTSNILKNLTIRSQINFKKYEGQNQLKINSGTYSYQNFKNDNLNPQIGSNYTGKGDKSKLVFSKGELIKYYKNYYKKLNKKKIKVYFSLPAIFEDIYDSESMIEWYKKMSEETGIPLLSYNENAYPREKMFDTNYHLNEAGRYERTQKIIQDIEKEKITSKINQFNNNEVFFITAPNQFQQIKLNDFYQLISNDDNLLINWNKKDTNNYARFKVKEKNLNNFNFMIKVKAEENLLKDIGYRDIGNDYWDYTEFKNNEGVFIKNNLLNTQYSDGNSYLGIWIKNIEKHINKNIIIVSTKISQTSIFLNSLDKLNLENNNTYFISEIKKECDFYNLLNSKNISNYLLKPRHKYILKIKGDEISIEDFYTKESFKTNFSKEFSILTNQNFKVIKMK